MKDHACIYFLVLNAMSLLIAIIWAVEVTRNNRERILKFKTIYIKT